MTNPTNMNVVSLIIKAITTLRKEYRLDKAYYDKSMNDILLRKYIIIEECKKYNINPIVIAVYCYNDLGDRGMFGYNGNMLTKYLIDHIKYLVDMFDTSEFQIDALKTYPIYKVLFPNK